MRCQRIPTLRTQKRRRGRRLMKGVRDDLFEVVDFDGVPVVLAVLDEVLVDLVDLVRVMISVALEDEELSEVIRGVDDRADSVRARDADVAAVDGLDGEQAAELGFEFRALGGSDVLFEVEEDDVV